MPSRWTTWTLAIGISVAAVLASCGDDDGDASATTGAAHSLYTHCGVVSTTYEDQLWLAEPPLADDNGNPPSGWDENTTEGTFVVLDVDTAEFRAASGVVARFARAPKGTRDPNEGCE